MKEKGREKMINDNDDDKDNDNDGPRNYLNYRRRRSVKN